MKPDVQNLVSCTVCENQLPEDRFDHPIPEHPICDDCKWDVCNYDDKMKDEGDWMALCAL